jgi:hypothetical protein
MDFQLKTEFHTFDDLTATVDHSLVLKSEYNHQIMDHEHVEQTLKGLELPKEYKNNKL